MLAGVWTGVGFLNLKNFRPPGFKNFGTGAESENVTPATPARHLHTAHRYKRPCANIPRLETARSVDRSRTSIHEKGFDELIIKQQSIATWHGARSFGRQSIARQWNKRHCGVGRPYCTLNLNKESRRLLRPDESSASLHRAVKPSRANIERYAVNLNETSVLKVGSITSGIREKTEMFRRMRR